MSKIKRSGLLAAALGILCLLVILFSLMPAAGQQPSATNITEEALTRAAHARIALETAIGFSQIGFQDVFLPPEYLQARYIDADGRLHVRLCAPTPEQEQTVRNALAEYADIVIYEGSPLEIKGTALYTIVDGNVVWTKDNPQYK